MTKSMYDEINDDFEFAEPEGYDLERADEVATVNCHHCNAEIFEDSPQCPECGTYLSESEFDDSTRQLWLPWTFVIIVAGIIAILIIAKSLAS